MDEINERAETGRLRRGRCAPRLAAFGRRLYIGLVLTGIFQLKTCIKQPKRAFFGFNAHLF